MTEAREPSAAEIAKYVGETFLLDMTTKPDWQDAATWGRTETVRHIVDALRAAASERASADGAAVPVAVKPLKWVRPPLSETLQRAETAIGSYRVWTHSEANGEWYWDLRSDWRRGGTASSEEQAKSACRDDHLACISGDLVTPPPDLRQAVESLEFYADEKNWIDTPSWDGDPGCITPKAIPVRRGEDGQPCDCGDTAKAALAAIQGAKT